MHVRLAWCFRKAATSPLKRCLACPVVRFGDGFCRCDRVHPNVCFTWHWAACSLVPGVRDDLTMLFGLLNSLARCHRVSGVRIVGSVMPLAGIFVRSRSWQLEAFSVGLRRSEIDGHFSCSHRCVVWGSMGTLGSLRWKRRSVDHTASSYSSSS